MSFSLSRAATGRPRLRARHSRGVAHPRLSPSFHSLQHKPRRTTSRTNTTSPHTIQGTSNPVPTLTFTLTPHATQLHTMPSHLVLTLTTPTSTTPYKTYTSHQPLITIGRASRTSLDLLDPSSGGMRNEGTAVMSSRHAQLSWQGHEYALLKDVGSTNGTMVVRKNEEPKQLTKGVVYRVRFSR